MENVRVLIANGSPAYLEVTKRMLEYQDESYQVDGVGSGAECNTKLGTGEYDVVVVDNNLIDGSGVDFIKDISHNAPNVPIILTVDESDEIDTKKSEDLGAFEVIQKKKGYLSELPGVISKAAEVKSALDIARQEKEEEPKIELEEPNPKNFRSLVPNYFHSWDAYVLRELVRRCDFYIWTIHDAFRIHPNHVDVLLQTVREIYAEIFQGNWLETHCKEMFGDEIEITKDLSVDDILGSTHLLT
jgi:CheY-like chemotaxis protein